MKETMNKTYFVSRFMDIRPDNFTYNGLEVLFDYLEAYEEDTGEELEFDPIALCCDFSEYQNLKEFQDDYGNEYETIEDIEYNTVVIPIDDDSFIIQNWHSKGC